MKYGNTTCGSQENVFGTWNNNYILVQHLNETGDLMYDSSVFGNNGTSIRTTFEESCQIDGGRAYTNDDDYLLHTMVYREENGLKIKTKPVKLGIFEVKERKY